MVALTARKALQSLAIFITSSSPLVWSYSPSSNGLLSLSRTSSSDVLPTARPATTSGYALLTKPGASLPQTYSFVAYLAVQIVHEGASFQGYCADLTKAQTVRLTKDPLVEWVLPTTSENCLTILNYRRSTNNSLHQRAPPEGDAPPVQDDEMKTRPDSAPQLRLLSEPEGSDSLPDYYFSPKLGVDQDIYIIDDGFDVDNPELRGRVVDTYAVPNRVALVSKPRRWFPDRENTIEEIPSSQGTVVAIIAAGNTLGVASAANLFLVKDTTLFNPIPGRPNGHWRAAPMSTAILNDIWAYIRNKVGERKDPTNYPNRRSIINISKTFKRYWQLSQTFAEFLDWAFSGDIVVVVSAGDQGYEPGNNQITGRSTTRLKDMVPQGLGTRANGLITVGGVNDMGVLDYQTTPSDGAGGSITVYALSDRAAVTARQPDGSYGFATFGGTAAAAPAVAGLAAYFFSLHSLQHRWHSGSVSTEMKDYISSWARVRTQQPFESRTKPDGYPIPPRYSIIVAYNGAHNGLTDYQDPGNDVPMGDNPTGDDPGC